MKMSRDKCFMVAVKIRGVLCTRYSSAVVFQFVRRELFIFIIIIIITLFG